MENKKIIVIVGVFAVIAAIVLVVIYMLKKIPDVSQNEDLSGQENVIESPMSDMEILESLSVPIENTTEGGAVDTEADLELLKSLSAPTK